MEYLRADRAVIVDAETGAVREIDCKETANALYYELAQKIREVTPIKEAQSVR